MFTLGHKALILNADRADITASATQCTIGGFCDVAIANAVAGSGIAAAPTSGTPAVREFLIPAANAIEGASLEVVIEYNLSGRYVSERASDTIGNKNQVIFQTAVLTAADVADDNSLAVAITAGWNAHKAAFPMITDWPFTQIADGLSGLEVRNDDGLIDIGRLTYRNVEVGNKTGNSYFEAAIDAGSTSHPVEAVGQGKFLEESIRVGGYTNMDPYSNKPNGSDNADVRGTYKLYEWVSTANGGWEGHENIGTTVVDQSIASKGQKFTVYVNTLATGLIADMDAWVGAI